MKCNNWSIKYHRLFDNILRALIKEVQELKASDPVGYKSHPKTKLLANVLHSIQVDIPQNPDHRKFRLGKTLNQYTSWRRAKNSFSAMRYRLFFRFMSENKTIIYAWLNDESTIRKAGDKNDVYSVFLKLLNRGDIENNFEKLLKSSVDPPTNEK